jgi:hypothetical protein
MVYQSATQQEFNVALSAESRMACELREQELRRTPPVCPIQGAVLARYTTAKMDRGNQRLLPRKNIVEAFVQAVCNFNHSR